MPRNSVQIEVGQADQLRIRPRAGGGFHLLIGEDERAILSFPHVGKAEEVAAVICTSAVTHRPLDAAVAETDRQRTNVAQFPLRATSTDIPPFTAA